MTIDWVIDCTTVCMETSVYITEDLTAVRSEAALEDFPVLALSDAQQIASTAHHVAVSLSRKATLNIRGFVVNAGVVIVGSTVVFGVWIFATRLFG